MTSVGCRKTCFKDSEIKNVLPVLSSCTSVLSLLIQNIFLRQWCVFCTKLCHFSVLVLILAVRAQHPSSSSPFKQLTLGRHLDPWISLSHISSVMRKNKLIQTNVVAYLIKVLPTKKNVLEFKKYEMWSFSLRYKLEFQGTKNSEFCVTLYLKSLKEFSL